MEPHLWLKRFPSQVGLKPGMKNRNKSEMLCRHSRGMWLPLTMNTFILKFRDGWITVKILKIGTPEIITIIVLQLEQLDFTVQYCVQKMQTE